MDNKSKWNVIRELGNGGKYPKTAFDVDVNKLKTGYFRIPTSFGILYDDLYCVPPQYSFSFSCVDQFEDLEFISAVKLNAVSSDDLDPLFLKVLTPRILHYF